MYGDVGMAIPHKFPSLLVDNKQAVIIVGAGFSTPIIPMLSELKEKLEKTAQFLGVSTATMDPSTDDYFYVLAEAVLKKLLNDKTDSEGRLWLAEELGVLDDRRWFGKIGLPLSGNTPRHRAIARFIVENCVRAVVSLNWDALLETALESIGLTEGANLPRPWNITTYARVVVDSHLSSLATKNVFPIIKPHGCVRELDQIRRDFRFTGKVQPTTFKLTQTELNISAQEQKTIDKEVECYVSKCPVIAVGWKATEDYLRKTIVAAAQTVQPTALDAFTLVSRSWYPNHDEIAIGYGKDKATSFIKVGTSNHPSLDCLFRWLQARYALKRLIEVATSSQRDWLQTRLTLLDQPECGDAILEWADSWLHTWTRLCWRAGVMQGFDPNTNDRKIEPWEIPVVPRDMYIPLSGIPQERYDLQAAATLLFTLDGVLGQFKFSMFPGGLWNAERQFLYLPLPSWQKTNSPADFVALKPFVEALRGLLGYVKKIYLVLLDASGSPPMDVHDIHCRKQQLEAQVRRLLPLTSFADIGTNTLSWVDLKTLKENPHAPLD